MAATSLTRASAPCKNDDVPLQNYCEYVHNNLAGRSPSEWTQVILTAPHCAGLRHPSDPQDDELLPLALHSFVLGKWARVVRYLREMGEREVADIIGMLKNEESAIPEESLAPEDWTWLRTHGLEREEVCSVPIAAPECTELVPIGGPCFKADGKANLAFATPQYPEQFLTAVHRAMVDVVYVLEQGGAAELSWDDRVQIRPFTMDQMIVRMSSREASIEVVRGVLRQHPDGCTLQTVLHINDKRAKAIAVYMARFGSVTTVNEFRNSVVEEAGVFVERVSVSKQQDAPYLEAQMGVPHFGRPIDCPTCNPLPGKEVYILSFYGRDKLKAGAEAIKSVQDLNRVEGNEYCPPAAEDLPIDKGATVGIVKGPSVDFTPCVEVDNYSCLGASGGVAVQEIKPPEEIHLRSNAQMRYLWMGVFDCAEEEVYAKARDIGRCWAIVGRLQAKVTYQNTNLVLPALGCVVEVAPQL